MRRSRLPRRPVAMPTRAPGGAHRRPGQSRRWPVVAIVVFSAFFLAVAAVLPARGAEFLSGDTPRVPVSGIIDDDVYMSGTDAFIEGTVTGDALVASRDLVVSGTVERSLIAAGQNISVTGQIRHAARVAAQEVRIEGQVEGDVLVAGAEVIIERGASVGGDLIVTAGTLTVRGTVGGDVRGNATEVLLDGAIGGDTRLEATELTLGPAAQLAGDLRYTSAGEANIDAQATVNGTTEREESGRDVGGAASSIADRNLLEWGRLVAALFSGLILVLILPRAVRGAAESARRRLGPALLLGVAMAFMIPIVSVIMLVTIIGFPIGSIMLVTFVIILYLSQVFVGTAIGRWILPDSWGDQGRGYNLLAMALGVVILGALRFLPIPGISFLVAGLTAVIGLGAVLLTLRRRTGALLPTPGSVATGPGPGYY